MVWVSSRQSSPCCFRSLVLDWETNPAACIPQGDQSLWKTCRDRAGIVSGFSGGSATARKNCRQSSSTNAAPACLAAANHQQFHSHSYQTQDNCWTSVEWNEWIYCMRKCANSLRIELAASICHRSRWRKKACMESGVGQDKFGCHAALGARRDHHENSPFCRIRIRVSMELSTAAQTVSTLETELTLV